MDGRHPFCKIFFFFVFLKEGLILDTVLHLLSHDSWRRFFLAN